MQELVQCCHMLMSLEGCIMSIVIQFTEYFYWRPATNPALLAYNQPSLTGTVLGPASRALLTL